MNGTWDTTYPVTYQSSLIFPSDSGSKVTNFGGKAGVLFSNFLSPQYTYSYDFWFQIPLSTIAGSFVSYSTGSNADNANTNRILSMNGSNYLFVECDGTSSGTVSIPFAFTDGLVHYFAISVNVWGVKRVYIDGCLLAVFLCGSDGKTNNGGLFTGGWKLGYSFRSSTWAGTYGPYVLGLFAMYNRVISSSEVAQHYFLGSGKTANVSTVVPAFALDYISSYDTCIINEAPMQYWKVNDTLVGNIADYSGNNIQGTMIVQSGFQLNQAILLNDASSRVAYFGTSGFCIASNQTVTNPTGFTIEFLFQSVIQNNGGGAQFVTFASVQTNYASIMDRSVYMNTTGFIVFQCIGANPPALISTSPYIDGKTHHVVAVSPLSGVSSLYVDGALVASGSCGAWASYTGYWKLGFTGNVNLNPSFSSSALVIGDVAIYNKLLNTSRITAHYGSISGGTC